MKILELKNISAGYGGLKVLHDISLDIAAGEIFALMGPNGAGKSTILKSIFGLIPHTGEIFYEGTRIHPRPYELVSMGIAYVPQGRRVFASLSVEENLEIGGFFVRDRHEIKRRVAALYQIFPKLKNKRQDKAASLSGGEQQLLAIARALVAEPKVLLLDEPTLGLAPKVVKEVFEKIKEINALRGTTIVIVEHNLKSLLAIVNRACLLHHGQVVTEDTPANIINSGILERVFTGK